ncbi:MAG: FeoB-associated Cys-rich membrane protein [Bacteroidetes bacterium]|nr:FeoB-associated Cys-rich membrane protein [Bacteroidota bacterium]
MVEKVIVIVVALLAACFLFFRFRKQFNSARKGDCGDDCKCK